MRRIHRASPVLLFVLWALAAAPAGATLIGQNLTVELISPGDSIMLSDSVTAAGGGDILPADGSNIGAVLLSTEFLDLGTWAGDQIVIGLEEGLPGGETGYAPLARYVISDIYLGTGLLISAVSVSTNNITTVVTTSFTNHSVTVFIDDIVIGEIPGIDSGTVTLDLTIEPIPEPGTFSLLLMGFAGLGAYRHRARQRARR